MKCPVCNGSGGWGHFDEERDIFGRTLTRERKERFYPCSMCHATGQVTEDEYSAHKKAEQALIDAYDREMGNMAEEFERELARDRREEFKRTYGHN